MDEVAQAMGAYNKELISVDFWKTYSLTPVGVKALSQCSNLEEVDLGWWSVLYPFLYKITF
jgi:F-box/leucine-rich repeat protein 4